MNQTNRTIYSSSLSHLFNKFNFQLKLDSFDSRTKLNELIIELNLELFLSWFSLLSSLITTMRNEKDHN
jgi:hypothetical protein